MKETHHTFSFPLPPFTNGGAGGTPVDPAVDDVLADAVLVSVNRSDVPTTVGMVGSALGAGEEDVIEAGGELLAEELLEAIETSGATEDVPSKVLDDVLVRAVVTVAVVVEVVATVVIVVDERSNEKVGKTTELGI
jgi:hypothetical protein